MTKEVFVVVMHKLRLVVGVVVGIGGLLVAASPAAADYGNGAAYQVGLSFNCMNPVACVASPTNPFGIGGFWGWMVVNKTGEVDGEVQFQGHQNADPSLNVSGHIKVDGFAVPTQFRLPFIPADPNGNYLLIFQCGPGGCRPVFEIEATGGHYAQHFGPGINNEIQVSQLP